MRQFNLKGEWLAPHAANESDDPGRTIYPEGLRMAEPGWVQQNWARGESVVRRESDVTEDQDRHAREWLWHLENGRIGGRR
jgi:hypothetical protein